MGYSMPMRDEMRYSKSKKKSKPKMPDMSQYDDTHYWTKPKNKK